MNLNQARRELARVFTDQPEIHLQKKRVIRLAGHVELRRHCLARDGQILECVQLANEFRTIVRHAIDQRGREEARRFGMTECERRAGLRLHAIDEGRVFFRRECRVEALSKGGNHAFSTNSPARMIMRSSAQISNLRPTTSMCVEQFHWAPV